MPASLNRFFVYTSTSMKNRLFYRNIRAGEQLDIFFISAIGSLLLTRAFLHLTGYPQIGGEGLNIAHMLPGGLLMAAAVVLNLSFIGLYVQRVAAFVGGIGFGLFIDELGKFITHDNNYFYEPAIGIIYAVFVVLYLTFNFLSRKQKFTSREYQLNALLHLEEAVLRDMDPQERHRALVLLMHADHRSAITRQLEDLVNNVELVPENKPGVISKILNRLDGIYASLWQGRATRRAAQVFFVVETAVFVLAISWGIFNNLDDIATVLRGAASYDLWLFAGQFISSIVAASFAIDGALLLKRSRPLAFEQFRRATLINLLLTEFFIFSRIEFAALPGFFFNVIVLLFITYVIHEERRLIASQRSYRS